MCRSTVKTTMNRSSAVINMRTVVFFVAILTTSGYGISESALEQPSSNVTSTIDIDGNAQFDALTDGLLLLRSMFGLTGTSLVTGALAADAIYTKPEDIQSRIMGLGDLLDIDNSGNLDALTDGLIILRYLFGLTGDALVSAAVASDALRVTSTEIELHMEKLVDITPPIISLMGNAEVYIELGSTYTDAGATAIDNIDGDITSSIEIVNNVDINTVGTYTVTYNVSDTAGNAATKVTRTINITPDVTIPVITLLGEAEVSLELGSTYTDAGATAVDNIDGDITANIVTVNPVDVNTVGTYTVTYSVSDTAGNTSKAVRMVIVTDSVIPSILLIGPAIVNHEQATPYRDNGATYQNPAGEFMPISTDGYVNTEKAGIYTLTYSASDHAGNTAIATRTVVVADTIGPHIELVGDYRPNTVHKLGDDYSDEGATASDLVDGDVIVSTSGLVNSQEEGIYTLTYSASDSSGNIGLSRTRTVVVEQDELGITLSINSHKWGRWLQNSFPIKVSFESVHEITSMTAQINSILTNLTYREDEICNQFGCYSTPIFGENVNLTSLPPGYYTMIIRATDITGETAETTSTFLLDRPPTLIVASPENLSVHGPSVPVSLSCTDDSGSCSVRVVQDLGVAGLSIIASAPNTLEFNADLSAFREKYGASNAELEFRATDAHPHWGSRSVQEKRTIVFDTYEFKSLLFNAPADVIDFSDNRVLHRSAIGQDLEIRNLITGDQKIITMPEDYEAEANAHLTPNGAIFTASNGPSVLDQNLFDFNDGNLYDLGYPNSTSSLVTRGNFAIWNGGSTINLRDLSKKTNRVVSTNAINIGNDVAETGTVAFGNSNYSIVLDSGGAQTTIASDAYDPLTDGNSVVYRKDDNGVFSLYVYRANNNTLLSVLGSSKPKPQRDYQINNGWIAFVDIGPSSNQTKIWTLSPDNVLLQRHSSDNSARIGEIIHIASNGELIFSQRTDDSSYERGYFLSMPDGTVTHLVGLNSAQGVLGHDTDGWHVILGSQVFRIQSPPLP